jgi:outer membrane protein with beta-barrel domain
MSLAIAAALLPARSAAAQSFGIGPRFSFVRANSSSATPATRLIGGTMRIATGQHTVLEGTLDYRSYLSPDGTLRTRETPMQGSLLLFASRGTFAPYVGAGIGLYSQVHDSLNSQGLVVATTTDKRVGWHMGVGAELRVAPHAAVFLDYRFRFVKFGEPDTASAERINIPGSTVFPSLQNVKLTHEGSMWSGGVAFYF